MKEVLTQAIEIKELRHKYPTKPQTDSMHRSWMIGVAIQFHGYNGISIAATPAGVELWKDLKMIVKATISDGSFTLNLWHDGKQSVLETVDRVAFDHALAEGMSYYV